MKLQDATFKIKYTKAALMARIEALERRVAELEARPFWPQPPQPETVPYWPPPWQITYQYTGDSPPETGVSTIQGTGRDTHAMIMSPATSSILDIPLRWGIM